MPWLAPWLVPSVALLGLAGTREPRGSAGPPPAVVQVRARALAAGARGDAPAATPRDERTAVQWSAEGEVRAARVEAVAGALGLDLTFAPVQGGHRLEVSGGWRRAREVDTVSVTLSLPGTRLVAMGRDLRPARVGHAVLERFDPKWIVIEDGARATTVVVDDTIDAVVARVRGRTVSITLELESTAARPFTHDARCAHDWRSPNAHATVPGRVHLPGDAVRARVQLLHGRPPPLLKGRFPEGRPAALVFTDHADQSSARTFPVLAEAFLRHGLVLTKALFARGTDRPQLEDAEVLRWADRLAEGGSEIVPHSATPRPDDRATTEQALGLFERWRTRTWIDHQPETNCEAFGNQGYRPGGRFGIADLLAAHRYEYVWAERDAPPSELNLLHPSRPGERAPTLWPVGRLTTDSPDGLWLFRTSWDFLPTRTFLATYAPRRLDRLEQERGLHVAHTYLETYHRKGSPFGRRNLFVPATPRGHPGEPGPARLHPGLEAVLGDLAARQARGALWVPTLAALGDRLRLEAEITLEPGGGEGAWLVRARRPVPGMTFVVPHPPGARVALAAAGRPPAHARDESDALVVWLDLPAGETSIEIRLAR